MAFITIKLGSCFPTTKTKGVDMTETTQTPLPTCPMRDACQGMMKKTPSGVALMLPGLLFIALGVLIVVEPTVLIWVMAVAFVLLGVMMLLMASFIRKISRSLHET